jgi:ubiquinone/menaquinone biosynthesis C-methylase UbiE
MDLKAHKARLRDQFAAQARVHAKTFRFRRAENVVPMIELAQPRPEDRLLDVACGWGFVIHAFRPRVASAAGVDLCPEMVELARRAAAERGLTGVKIVEGDAEDLEFPSGSFDIVTCRFTFHHFGRPLKALAEMKRMLAPRGRLVLYDYLASSDAARAKRLNEIELARDPCHVRTYSLGAFQEFFREAGLAETARVVTLMKREFDPWMAFVDADEDRRNRVRKLLEDSIEGNAAGLGPRVRDGVLVFTHTCVAWLLQAGGSKP